MVAPLLEIRRLPQPAPDLTDVAALAFTSPNGVEAFAALTPARHLPVFAVGDATADAARACGFRDAFSAEGAIEDLARLLAARAPKGWVLAAGAREPAGDLAALAPGVRLRRLAVYAAHETGAAAPSGALDAVLAHSPRASRALAPLLASLSAPLPASRAGSGGPQGRPALIAISAAAAEPLRPYGPVRVAAAPNEAAMLDALSRALGKPDGAV